GYARPDGRAGVRNVLLVLAINGLVARAAARIAAAVAGSVLVATSYGRGQFGDDQRIHRRQLEGLACNPNVGATLVVGADRVTADAIAQVIATASKVVDVVALDDVHEDALVLSARGIVAAARMARELSRQRRQRCDVATLFVGVECGHSDATSGLVANPVVGAAIDRLIDAGATAVFGETIEWLGAEHLLAARAATPAVAHAIGDAVTRRERAVAAIGVDLTGNNPGAENIRGGLSSIEEKSLGAIAKGGKRRIDGVLQVAQAPSQPGLYVMDGPGFSPESMTGFAAAGAQLMLFTTGAGNSFCNSVAPTIKVSARPDTIAALPAQIDFDASAVFQGLDDVDSAGARLYSLLLEVASGSRTWGEVLGEGAESFIRIGGSL
ncbi:MAG: UxaA family hydrolase, partial [Casimicrobiaceae bacterium]